MRQLRLPQLDERLKTVFDLFPACDIGADIGADHGRLSCNLLAQGKVKHMLVTDLSAPSLEKAKQLFRIHGLENCAEFCLGDGLSALEQPAEGIAICGMGGEVIRHILTEGKGRLHGASVVVSPQTDLPLVRKTVSEIGYHITGEETAFSAGRYYVILKAEPGNIQYSEKELFLGPVLMTNQGDRTRGYYAWRYDVECCVKDLDPKYLEWLREVM